MLVYVLILLFSFRFYPSSSFSTSRFRVRASSFSPLPVSDIHSPTAACHMLLRAHGGLHFALR